ncbi:MAG: hypothetical protein QOE05_2326 [Actinomycetota bacterium]|jgi:hypothetical protein|nr:hypothetical protein [Actinomycetota bacterium]
MRRWAPIAAALSVIAVAVAVSLVFGRSPGGDPPPLRLAAGGGTDTAGAADAPMASSKLAASGSSFVLVGTLPSGPDESRAHPLSRGAAKEDDVRRLAAALRIKDEPRRVEHAWQAGILRVEDVAGNPWSMYAGCGPDQPVSSEGAVSICSSGTVDVGEGSSGSSGSGSAPAPGTASGSGGAVDSGPASTPNSTTVAPPPPAPAPVVSPCPDNARCAKPGWAPAPPSPGPTADVEAARRTAKVVLNDLGLGDAVVSVQGAGEHVFVQADPRVDGLRTWGYATQLEIDADNNVVGGNGYLGQASSGASYPLISAKQAFDDLPEQPRTMMLCPQTIGSEPACPEPVPAKVTGAELGLQLTALADEDAALLPAWLFTVETWPMPLAQPAIEPRFLQLPEPVKVDPGLVDPGQVDPVPPAEPPVPPSASRRAFSFDAAFPTDEPNVIVVQYGDSGSCPHTNVTPTLKESVDSIVVVLEGDAQSTKQACTDDYRQQLVTLKLGAPLGDRKVIDGSRGEPVAVDHTCARPMGQPAAPKSCKG